MAPLVVNAIGARKVTRVYKASGHGMIFMVVCSVLVFGPIPFFLDAILSTFACRKMDAI